MTKDKDPTQKTIEEPEAKAKAKEQPDKPIESDNVKAFLDATYFSGEEEKPKPEKPPADKGKEKKPKPQPKPEAITSKIPPPVDYDRLAAAAGEGAARALAEAQEKKPAPKEAKPEDELDLDEAEQHRLKVLRHMEESNPHHKGLTTRYLGSLKALAQYAEKWERENPGKTFKQEDEEHAEAIAKFEADADYDEGQFDKANRDLIKKEAIEEAKLELEKSKTEDPDLVEWKRERKIQKEEPNIIQSINESAYRYWESLGDDFAEAIVDGKLNKEFLANLKETAPEKFDEALNTAFELRDLTRHLYLLSNRLVTPFTGEKPQRAAHAFLDQKALQWEEEMMAEPPESRLDSEGRTFVRLNDYAAMSARQRERHWTYGFEDMKRLLAIDLAKRTKDNIAAYATQFARMAKARGLDLSEESAENTAEPSAKPKPKPAPKSQNAPEEEEQPDPDESTTPTVGSEPRLATRQNKGKAAPKSPMEAFYDRAI